LSTHFVFCLLIISQYIPQVDFQDLGNLTSEQLDTIRHKGSVVIRGVVEEREAAGWKTALEDFIKSNPHVEGGPSFQNKLSDSQLTPCRFPRTRQTILSTLVRNDSQLPNVHGY
jgi:hypothetical protein